MKTKNIIFVLLVVFVIILYFSTFRDYSNIQLTAERINQINIYSKNMTITDYKVVFLTKFTNFNCPSCFIDFIELTDSIKKHYPYNKKSVLYLFERDLTKNILSQENFLTKWMDGLSIKYDFSVCEDYTEIFRIESNGIILKQSNHFEIITFPLGEKSENTFNKVMKLLKFY